MTLSTLKIFALTVAIVLGTVEAGQSSVIGDKVAGINAGNTSFAIDLYKMVANESNENIVFSPVSISMAIAMASVGAGGETTHAIRAAMHFPRFDNQVHGPYLALNKHFEKYPDKYAISIANALWCEASMPVSKKFLNHTNRFYHAGIQTVDFLNSAEDARLRINQWTAGNTDNKIVDLLTKGMITPQTRLILTNAIYFKSEWNLPFDVENTRDQKFRTLGDGDVETPMMRLTATIPYRKFDGFSAVAMPYNGEWLQMVILLPDSPDDMSTLVDSLSQPNLDMWVSDLQTSPQEVNLLVPRFKLTQQIDLTSALSELGMQVAFSDEANFRGITIAAKLKLTGVVHKSFIEVNEEGTEAAAATGAVMGTTSIGAPPPTFNADHPFVYLIRDKVSGFVLFMGRVSNPATTL